jgi:cytochrome c5
MLKLELFALLLMLPAVSFAQTAADMAKKVEATCVGVCHGPSLIAQQRLDRNGWTREIDKMTRWGAKVDPTDRDALIAYLASTFNPSRPIPNSAKAVPAGKGSDVFQKNCFACHDDRVVTSRKLDKPGWTAVVAQMLRWGAYVPADQRDELIDYLTANWGK